MYSVHSAYGRRASERVAKCECSGLDARARVQPAQCVRVRELLLRRRLLRRARAGARQELLAQRDRLLQHAPVVRHALPDAVYAHANATSSTASNLLHEEGLRSTQGQQQHPGPKRPLRSGNRFRRRFGELLTRGLVTIQLSESTSSTHESDTGVNPAGD